MIIESLCHFPETNRKRATRAEETITRLLSGFRSKIRWVVIFAVIMQTVLLAIPAAVNFWLPSLLAADGSSFERQARDLACLTAIVILVGITRAIANYRFLCLSSNLGHELVAALRLKTYEHLMRLPTAYLEKRGAGRILLRFISDSDALRSWFSRSGPKLVADSITAGVIVIALVWIQPMLSLVLSFPVLLCFIMLKRLSQDLRDNTRKARQLQARLSGQVEYVLTHIRLSKIERAKKQPDFTVASSIESVADCNTERDRSAANLEAWGQSVIFMAIPLLLGFGLLRVWAQQMRAADLVTFVWLSLHLLVLMRNSLASFVIHQKALVSIQRLYVLMARPAESGRGTNAIKPTFSELTIVAKTETFTFKPGVHILPSFVNAADLLNDFHGFKRSKKFTLAIDRISVTRADVQIRRSLIGRLEPIDFYSGNWFMNIIEETKKLGLRIAVVEYEEKLAFSTDDLEQWRTQLPFCFLLIASATIQGQKLANQLLIANRDTSLGATRA